jgi:sugar lactone lactonase YvrE
MPERVQTGTLFILLASTLAIGCSSSDPRTLTLLAGQPGGGPGRRDGTGTAARFNGPARITTDGVGNLYVVDAVNNTIRKIVIATGAVSTLAGTPGMWGSADGTGAAATFDLPVGIVSDGAGNLYVSSTGDNTIRKIVIATGAASTLAGSANRKGYADGTGAAAVFNEPKGITSDGAGNLYVADSMNNMIRKIVIATGEVSTFAGSVDMYGSADGSGAAATFLFPFDVASDGAGSLYVADTGNGTIRKIVIATDEVSTLAGTASKRGSTDGVGAAATFRYAQSVTTDAAGNLYVADFDTIRKIAIASGEVSTLAGTTDIFGSADGVGAAARFWCASGDAGAGIVSDGAGNLYVADSTNNTIRKIVIATRAVTTLAGKAGAYGSADGTGAAARLNAPQGVASDGVGNLYVTDGNDTIRKIVIATGVVSTLAGTAGMDGSADGAGAAARFGGPLAVASDGAGNLYVAEGVNRTIRKIVIETGVVSTLAGTAGMDGSADGAGPAARFYFPDGIASDGSGNLYVADAGNNTIRKIVIATGVVSTLAGTAQMTGSADGIGAAARFSWPEGVGSDGAGNLYVADNNTIRKIVIATGVVSTLAGRAHMTGSADGIGAAARFSGPAAVASDGAGNLYVADSGNHTIRKIVIATGAVTTPIGVAGNQAVQPGPLPASLNAPVGLAVIGMDLAITDANENAVLIAHTP